MKKIVDIFLYFALASMQNVEICLFYFVTFCVDQPVSMQTGNLEKFTLV